jgi:hypothetical protein
MNYSGIAQQVTNFVRPTATTGPTVKEWLLTWLNERLRILYKRRKWRFCARGQGLTTVSGTSIYDLSVPAMFGTKDFMLGECYATGKRLSSFTSSAGSVFYTTPGTPRALSDNRDGTISVFPQPNGAFPLIIEAFIALPDLTSNAPGDTNYLTELFAPLCIAGGVASSFAQLQEYQKASAWEEDYERQVMILANHDQETWKVTPTIGALPQLTFPIIAPQPAQRGQQ